MGINIREAQDSELESIVKLTNGAYRIPYKQNIFTTSANDSLKTIKNHLKDKSVIFVAKASNHIVGAVRCQPFGGHVLIHKLAVDPDHREKGIARRLLDRCAEYAKTIREKELLIKVIEEKGLTPYYERLGFLPIKKYINKNGHIEVLMTKKI